MEFGYLGLRPRSPNSIDTDYEVYVINPGSRHGMTDLYHGNHYDVITLPRGASGAAIQGSLRSSRTVTISAASQ